MAAVIGTVSKVEGIAIVVDEKGNRHLLKIGEALHAGDKVITGPGSKVVVKLTNGELVNFVEAQTVKITDNLAEKAVTDATESAVDQSIFDAVITALNEGRDVTEVLEAPAAGVISDDGNSTFISIDRVQTADLAVANYDGGRGVAIVADGNAISPPANFVFLQPAGEAPTVSLSQDQNPNNGFISKSELSSANFISATIGLPLGVVAGDLLNINDNNGSRIIVISAEDIARGSVIIQVSPLPAEGATVIVSASITNQSGQTSLVASDSAILDTIAPSAPTAIFIVDNIAATPENIVDNGNSKDNLPEFQGTGLTPGNTVTVTITGANNRAWISLSGMR